MINIQDYEEQIAHSKCKQGIIESCEYYAYKVDGKNGLSEKLGFNNGRISQVDYCLIEDNNAQFIELTDISDAMKECIINEKFLLSESTTFSQILKKDPEKAIRIVKSKIWSEVLSEFKNKWMGSIAVLERYCRKDSYDHDFNYSMVIVLKNGTDSMQLDSLRLRLKGMIGDFNICTTDNIEALLIVKSIK